MTAVDTSDVGFEALAAIAFGTARSILDDNEEIHNVSRAALAALLAHDDWPEEPAVWLTAATKNLAVELIECSAEGGSQPAVSDAEEFLDRVAARMLLDQALERLAPQHRQALEARLVGDLSQVTVAEALKVGAQAQEGPRRGPDPETPKP